MNNQNQQPFPFQYQQPEEQLFSKTVFFSILVAFVVLAIILFGVYYFVLRKPEELTESLEETLEKSEQFKAKKSKSALAQGLKVQEIEVENEEPFAVLIDGAVEKVEEKVEENIQEILP